MTRPRKVFVAIVGSLAGLVLAVPVLLPFLVDGDRLRATAQATLQTALNRPVALGPVRLSLWSGVALRAKSLRIGGAPGGDPSSALVVEAGRTAVHVALRPLLRREFEVRSIAIEGLRITRSGRPLVADARVSSRVRLAPGGVVEFTKLHASIGPVRVAADGRVSGLSAPVPRLTLSGSARLARSLVNGRFDVVAGPPRPTASFELASPLLDADEILAAVRALTGPRPAARAGGLSIVPETQAAEPAAELAAPAFVALEAIGTLRADRCVARGLEMTGLSMRLALDEGVATLSDISLALYGGAARGSLTVQPFAPGLPFSVDQIAERVSIGPLIAALAPAQAGTVEGTASLSVRLKGDAGAAAMLPTITGEGDVSIADGKIVSVGVIRQVMKALSAAGARGIERDETPFDRLSAHFDVADAAARTEDLRFRSEAIDGDGAGSIGLGGLLNLDVLASFSKRVSAALVAKTHALAVRLGADGRLSVPLLIRGTIQEPRIQLDLQRMLGEGVLRELKKEGTKSLLKKLLGR